MDKRKSEPKFDWDIHYVSNGEECSECGKTESSFPEYICDAHTDGMAKYGHLDFQVVINYGPREVFRLLNTMGLRVRHGEKFANGDQVSGLYEDCKVRLREITDCNGNPILRLVISDRQNRLPEQSEPPFTYQMLATGILYSGGR